MKRFLLWSIATAGLAVGNAQINSPAPDGYFERGLLMYRDGNFQGALYQLNHLLQMPASSEQLRESQYYIGMSLLSSGDIDGAKTALNKYLELYSASPRRPEVMLALADCDFFQSEYAEALNKYSDIRPSSLDLAKQEDLTYRIAFSRMMLGDMDKAMRGFSTLNNTGQYGNAARYYQAYIYYTEGDYRKARDLFARVDTSTPPGNGATFYLTQIEFAQGNYQKALSMARQAIQSDTEFRPEMERVAGESLYNLGEEDAAIPYLKRYISATDDPAPSALYLLGVSEYKAGDISDAVKTLTPVTACDDAMGQSAYLYIGQAYLKLGNLNSALMALEQASRMNYDSAVQETAYYNYAVARMEGGRTPFGSSVATFETFLKRYPNSRYASEVQEYLITGYMTDNNYEQALASIERIKRPSDNILTAKQRVLYILGSRDLASGNVDRALARFKEAKSLASLNKSIATECDLWIGDCYYRKGNYSQASKAFNDYLKATTASSPNRAIAYYDLGYSRFGEKRYSSARTDFERVLKSALPDEVKADTYNRIGDCYYYESQFSKAAEAYDTAYTLNHSAGDYALYQKALMRGLNRDHPGKIDLLDRMMAEYPTSGLMPSALLEKAESHVASGNSSEAIRVYNQLVDKFPSTAQGRNGYLQLAITLLSTGNKDKAIDSYKRVIKSYPTSEEARIASDDLKRIYADDGRLNEYSRFIASVPNAPKLEVSEMDRLTFESAEKDYLTNGSVHKLTAYLNEYPHGMFEPQTLSYLAAKASETGNDNDALRYASLLVERYPDAESAEDALAIKGNVELKHGDVKTAVATFRTLAQKASASRNVFAAQLGIMRGSLSLKSYKDALAAADKILASTSISSAAKNEAIYSRAEALSGLGRPEEAVKEWSRLAKNTDDLFGAKSAYYLSQYYFDSGKTSQARKSVESLIDSNTPHQYWLARGYILLSDIHRKQGNDFEANEYLKSLKENYPGNEADIFQMIDKRLK
ncbi:MAG: tetratricopeptide repeat protein [Muribaculum sp.]|nr:tetratricopeptide repeat protein [Muribaculum sp.]